MLGRSALLLGNPRTADLRCLGARRSPPGGSCALDKAQAAVLCSAGPAARTAGGGPLLEDVSMVHPSPARLGSLRGFIVDLDGVLWRSGEALPGASVFMQWLEAQSLPYVVATHDPTPKPPELAGWLRELRMPVPPARVLT